MYSPAYVWAKIINYLEERLSALTISASFDDAELIELNEEQLILYSPSEFRREVIQTRYTAYIQEALFLFLKESRSSSPKTISLASELKISFKAS